VRYQDLKVRDALRLGAIAAACVVGAGLLWGLGGAPAMGLGPAIGLTVFLALIVLATAGMAAHYLATTPEQNAARILKAGVELPPTLDAADPDYRTPTWKYLRERRGGRQRR
jgi:hypothetical protein